MAPNFTIYDALLAPPTPSHPSDRLDNAVVPTWQTWSGSILTICNTWMTWCRWKAGSSMTCCVISCCVICSFRSMCAPSRDSLAPLWTSRITWVFFALSPPVPSPVLLGHILFCGQLLLTFLCVPLNSVARTPARGRGALMRILYVPRPQQHSGRMRQTGMEAGKHKRWSGGWRVLCVVTPNDDWNFNF